MLYLFNCFAIHILLTISWKAFANLRLFTEECLEEHVVLAKIEKPAPSHPKFPRPNVWVSHGRLLLCTLLLVCCTKLNTNNVSELRAFLSFHPERPSSCVKAEAISSPGDPCVNSSIKDPTVVNLFQEFQININPDWSPNIEDLSPHHASLFTRIPLKIVFRGGYLYMESNWHKIFWIGTVGTHRKTVNSYFGDILTRGTPRPIGQVSSYQSEGNPSCCPGKLPPSNHSLLASLALQAPRLTTIWPPTSYTILIMVSPNLDHPGVDSYNIWTVSISKSCGRRF